MKKIKANFEIIDNTGNNYSASITINNPYTNNEIQEIENRIMQVYNVSAKQIISISNIEIS
jgi:hypothetical protein